MKTRVMIDPDGTAAPYLFIIVAASTGTVYEHQCGGLANLLNLQEGFIVNVGDGDSTKILFEWFWREFKGNCMDGSVWTPARIESLEQLICGIVCWHTDDTGADSRQFLKLDRGRMNECVEAWIPVESPYGSAILVLNNSD